MFDVHIWCKDREPLEECSLQKTAFPMYFDQNVRFFSNSNSITRTMEKLSHENCALISALEKLTYSD